MQALTSSTFRTPTTHIPPAAYTSGLPTPPTHIPPAAYPSGLPIPPTHIPRAAYPSELPNPQLISLLLPILLGSLTPVLSRLWML